MINNQRRTIKNIDIRMVKMRIVQKSKKQFYPKDGMTFRIPELFVFLKHIV
jgi:hypothetical protein